MFSSKFGLKVMAVERSALSELSRLPTRNPTTTIGQERYKKAVADFLVAAFASNAASVLHASASSTGNAAANESGTPTNPIYVVITGVLSLAIWVWAAWSSVVQKQRADKSIGEAFDISAIQIQQLNGQVTAHVLMAIAVAFAGVMPLVLALALRKSSSQRR